jgi:hypothetical protein
MLTLKEFGGGRAAAAGARRGKTITALRIFSVKQGSRVKFMSRAANPFAPVHYVLDSEP